MPGLCLSLMLPITRAGISTRASLTGAGLALVDASRDKTEEIRHSDDGSALVVPADSPSQGSQHSCRVLSFSSPPKPSSPSRRSPVQPKWGNVVSPSTLFLTSLLEFLSPLSHTRGPP